MIANRKDMCSTMLASASLNSGEAYVHNANPVSTPVALPRFPKVSATAYQPALLRHG